MIHVTIYQDSKNRYIGFEAEGHAGYADAGDDIVCAAASVLMINTVNALEAFTEDRFRADSDETSGQLRVMLQSSPTKEGQLLLKTLVLGLTQMEDDENYAEYIDLTFEEVQLP